jgi:hypothetical protein
VDQQSISERLQYFQSTRMGSREQASQVGVKHDSPGSRCPQRGLGAGVQAVGLPQHAVQRDGLSRRVSTQTIPLEIQGIHPVGRTRRSLFNQRWQPTPVALSPHHPVKGLGWRMPGAQKGYVSKSRDAVQP